MQVRSLNAVCSRSLFPPAEPSERSGISLIVYGHLGQAHVPAAAQALKAKLAGRNGEHVMTVAPIFARYLQAENIKYDVIAHEPTTTSSRTAQTCHIPGDRMVKGIVLRGDDAYTLAVLPASRRIRMTDLQARIGPDVALASEVEINRLFRDCVLGAVPPVGPCYGLDVIVDDSIQEQPDVYLEGGDHVTLVHMSSAQFARLTAGAPHGHFSVHMA